MSFERPIPAPLDPLAFAAPDPQFGSQIEWLWAGCVDENLIDRYLREFSAQGIGEVVIEAWDGLVAGTEPGISTCAPYLSERFMDLVLHTFVGARDLGLHIWIYDGNGAGDDTGAQKIALEGRDDLRGMAKAQLPDGSFREIFGGFDKLNPDSALRLIEVQHQPLVDLLSEFTPARGGETFRGFWKDEPKLGLTFASFEQIGMLPWSRLFPDYFQARNGYDIEPPEILASVLRGSGAEDRKRRVDYWSAIAQMYAENHFRPLQQWHAAHGLHHLVQPLVDNVQFREQMRTQGSMFVMQQFTDVVGTDMWPGMHNDQALTGEGGGMIHAQGTSIAHMYGRSRVQAEPYGLEGWGLELAQQKALADRIYVRGGNLISPAVTHVGFNQSQATFAGDFGPMNPMWDFYGLLQTYMSRVGELLCGAEHAASVALLHPMTTVWAMEPGEEDTGLQNVYRNIGGVLQMTWRNFDVITEEILSDPATKVEQGEIRRYDHRFKTLILPGLKAIQPQTLSLLEQFVSGGGALITVGELPSQLIGDEDNLDLRLHGLLGMATAHRCEIDLSVSSRIDEASTLAPLLELLDHVVPVNASLEGGAHIGFLPAHEIYHARRADSDIFFINNYPENAQQIPRDAGPPRAHEASLVFRCRSSGVPELWDADTGIVRPAPFWWREGELLCVPLNLPRFGATAVVVREAHEELAHVVRSTAPIVSCLETRDGVRVVIAPATPGMHEIEVEARGRRRTEEVEVRNTRQRMMEGDFDLTFTRSHRLPIPDIAEPSPMRRGSGNLAEDARGFSGTVTYTTRFEASGLPDILDLGEVLDYATVKVDGEEIGRRAWPPYRFDLTGVSPGDHELTIAVTNTAANAMPGPDYQADKPFGLLGPVTLQAKEPVVVNVPTKV